MTIYYRGMKTAPTSKVRRDFLIPDALWKEIEPLIPPPTKVHKFGGGRPRVSPRKIMDGIFFVLRTGCQWNALNKTGLCSSSTAHRRFQEWVSAGIFTEIWKRGLRSYDCLKGIDWEWQSMDGAMTKAPLGGEKMRTQSYRPRKTRS